MKNVLNFSYGVRIVSAFFTMILMMLLVHPVSAASVYGALYEAGNLVAENGSNRESVIMYYPGVDGFISVTTNDTGAEWWVSNELGLNWELSETNPLTEYGCTSLGRHTVVTFNADLYFAANCTDGGSIFKLTSIDTAELIHVHTSDDEIIGGGYPTGTVLNDVLYMFFDGGFTSYDGNTFTDVTDATGQTDGVPLEVSDEQNGFIYAAQTTGEVQTFDGESYETIGENYLEGAIGGNNNLPSIEVFNDTVYVGNQDMTNGATLFKYDPDDEDEDGELWEVAEELDVTDMIINKMQMSDEIDGSNYLVFYTSNADLGTTINAIDEEGNVFKLVDSGLGGTNPENNQEVVAVINRTVTDGGIEKDIMLFATQNPTDETKIFVLNIDADLAEDPTKSGISSSSLVLAGKNVAKVKKGTTQKGKVFTYRIKKKNVEKGAVYSLYVNGKKVSEKIAKKKQKVVLKYAKAKKKKRGATFIVRIGVKHTYGTGSDQLVAKNVIKGNKLKVTVRKKK